MADPMEIYLSLDDVPLDEPVEDSDGDDSVLQNAVGAYVPAAPTLHSTSPQQTRLYVPFLRTLKRGVAGKDVLAVKRALAKAGYLKTPRRWTLFYGPYARRSVRIFQHDHGLTSDGVYGPATHAKLARYFDAYGAYLIHHTRLVPTSSEKRKLIAAAAVLGWHNAWSIHYTQGPMRMDGVKHHLKPPQFGHWEDCSSFVTWAYYAAGASDPNGLGYNGYGFTGTLAAHGSRTTTPKVGDLALYGWAPYRHVTVVVGFRSGAPLCVSHGSEIGPLLVPARYRSDFAHYQSYLP